MPGLFGAQCRKANGLHAILERLPELRRRSVLRVEPGKGAWAALMSGAHIAQEPARDFGTGATDPAIVSFAGHLAGAVAGIDVPGGNPAEAVRIAYRKWGTGCFERLNGNFSVAIYDPAIPRMLVARDAAGTKPVFYSNGDDFVFGTSAIEVLRASGLSAIANPRALRRYLIDGRPVAENETLLDGVCALPASHYLEVAPGSPPSVRGIPCAMDAQPRNVTTSLAQSSGELRSLLLETVKAQSSCVKAGVALSGGIDSSGIIACLRVASGPCESLNAFTFVHGHPALPDAADERPWAELAAKHVQATLHPVRLQAAGIPNAMKRIFGIQDFPFGSPVVLAQAEVFRIASDHGIQVMLSGHGPDILFGGGGNHAAARASLLLRQGRIFTAWAVLRGASGYVDASLARLVRSSLRQALRLPGLYPRYAAPRAPWMKNSWFGDRAAGSDREAPIQATDPMRRVVLEQLFRSSLPIAVHIEECNAMAHGLDNRLPYLAGAMLSFAAGLPPEHLVSDAGVTKHVLRHALKGLVPDAILQRRNRTGFVVPAIAWLHELQPWVDERLSALGALPFFQQAPASTLWEELQGKDSSAWTAAFRAWRWITLLEWAGTHDVRFP